MIRGTARYCSKEDLYDYVQRLKAHLGLTNPPPNKDFMAFCKNTGWIKLDAVPFQDISLGGLCIPTDDLIILNKRRSPAEMNFDCCHEFIHIMKHKKETSQTFVTQ